jgi:hypothetical protein
MQGLNKLFADSGGEIQTLKKEYIGRLRKTFSNQS